MQTGTRGIVANMKLEFFANLRKIGASAAFVFTATAAMAEPKHGIAMYGEPALPPDFVSLPYANPDAPLGGKLVTANVGTFDSLNPLIVKGLPAANIRGYVIESLLAMAALERAEVPANVGLEESNTDPRLRLTRAPTALARARIALKVASGFGGMQQALLFQAERLQA